MSVGIFPTNKRGLVAISALVAALLCWAGALAPYSAAAATPITCSGGRCSLIFSQAGASTQDWEVLNGLTAATFVVNGAGGGSDTYGGNGGPGGNGAQVTATVPLTGGESLQLLVGTGGQRTESRQGALGGFGGGGAAGTGTELGAAGGGGGSFVFQAGAPLIVAGGGGGAAVEGLEGGDAGEVGADGGNYESYAGAEGATQSNPGAGGRGITTGASGTGPTTGPGALAQGGAGEGGGAKFAGGGGGGGYYGGGGGGGGGTGSLANEYSNTGGGGGSSYVAAGTGIAYSSGGGAGGYGFENFNEESEEEPAEAGSITISFTQPTMSISLQPSSLSPAVNSAETLTATVSPVPNSGTVAFVEGSTPVAGCASVAVDGNGEASCTTEYSAAGEYEPTAEYSGSTDTVYRGARSETLSITASNPATATSTSLLTSSVTPTIDTPVTFTATVSPTPDGGTVAFDDDAATIPGCGSVAVDVSTSGAACVTSLSTAGAHVITAEFSGSLDGEFTASLSEALSVTAVEPVRVAVGGGSAAPTPTPSGAPAAASPATAAPQPSVFALLILTREAKPLLNRRVIAVRVRCGAVACALRATMTVELPGMYHALFVGSADATLAVSTAGNALIPVPAKLRSVVRRYLLDHPHQALTLRVDVTATAVDHLSQSGIVTLTVWTYSDFR
jgi:hypothetical protein